MGSGWELYTFVHAYAYSDEDPDGDADKAAEPDAAEAAEPDAAEPAVPRPALAEPPAVLGDLGDLLGTGTQRWGPFSFTRTATGFQATCPFHALNDKSGCKKRLACGTLGEVEVIRRLKFWCTCARDWLRQEGHVHGQDITCPPELELMEVLLDENNVREPPAPGSVLTDEQLDQLEAACEADEAAGAPPAPAPAPAPAIDEAAGAPPALPPARGRGRGGRARGRGGRGADGLAGRGRAGAARGGRGAAGPPDEAGAGAVAVGEAVAAGPADSSSGSNSSSSSESGSASGSESG